MSIHPTAIIEDGAELGVDAAVGPGAYIQKGAVIGDRCRIGPNAVIYSGTTLGQGCTVHAGAVLGDTPQDLAFKNVPSYLEIGDDCTIRELVTLHRGTEPETKTIIGNSCYLMACSHAAHNCVLEDHVILANSVLLAGYVTIGSRCFVGGNAAIHQFCHVGRLAIVGGLAAISQDVPPFCMASTGQLNLLSGLNTIGLKRAGIDPAARQAIKSAYKTVFRSGLGTSKGVEKALSDHPEQDLVHEFCQFISESKRGVCSDMGRKS